jgi:hypothetical protein
MTTYSDLQNRIADELQRTDLTAEIVNAIGTAIQFYERKRFYFNELRDNGSWSTTIGQEFYGSGDSSLIYTMPSIDQVSILAFTNRLTLTPRTAREIEEISVGTTWTGMPTDWCFVNEQIRMYPIPNLVYPVYLTGTQRLTALINPSDTNAWMVDAETLIRCRAKFELFTHVLRDPQNAALMSQAEQIALSNLKAETASRVASGGRIRISGYF